MLDFMTRRPTSQEFLLLTASTIVGILLWLLFDFFVISALIKDQEESGKAASILYDHGWYTLAPNAHATIRWGRDNISVCTDSNGFRIDCRSIAQPQLAEVLFLGDSFAFGEANQWEDTFVGIFERKTHYSVINAGVGSYSPTPYLWQYKRALSTGLLRPHPTVIVSLDISDVQDEAAVWDDGPDHPIKQPMWMELCAKLECRTRSWDPRQSALREFLSSQFLATRQIYRFFRDLSGGHKNEPPPNIVFDQLRSAFTWRDWSQIENGSNITYGVAPINQLIGYRPLGVQGGLAKIREKLKSISVIAKENGSSLWILIYPWPAQLRYPSTVFDWERFSNELCAEIGCRGVINTFPSFRSQASGIDWYSKFFVWGDVHYNRVSNEVVADEIIAAMNRDAGDGH
jgi:hypothetical protein